MTSRRPPAKLEKAETSYNKVKTDFPESSFADIAGKRLAILKAKPPAGNRRHRLPLPPPTSPQTDAIKSRFHPE